MKFTISQIATLIQADIQGDPLAEIFQLAPIEEGLPGSICFLANPKYIAHLYTTQATAVIVSRDLVLQEDVSATLLRVDHPYESFTQLLELASEVILRSRTGIEEPAFIADSAEIGEDVYIGAFAYIGENVKIGNGAKIFPNAVIGEGVTIGDNTLIYPNVTVYYATQIGANCILHAGACIGSDGFGFVPKEDGTYRKIPQLGQVVIEDDVEVGANTTIDRATMGTTYIRKGVKLDNLAQLAHNVDIGAHTVIAAQAGIAGSTKIGNHCMIGGQVGIVGHITLADQTKIDAQSGVNRSIDTPGLAFRGSPIQAHRDQLRSEVMFRKLTDMHSRLHDLELRIQELTKST